MCKSNAQRGKFLFAQLTKDGFCHLSLDGESRKVDVLLTMVDVGRIIDNLQSVQFVERTRFLQMSLQQMRKIEELQQQIEELVMDRAI